MKYKQKISNSLLSLSKDIFNFSEQVINTRIPTQASSNFITNKKQGDWAEDVIQQAINNKFKDIIAVKYGKSDNKVAGEEGFETFYQEYIQELEIVGKRPDILIFTNTEYDQSWNFDISKFSLEQLEKIVPKAIYGLEVRSSSFFVEKYNKEIQESINENTRNILEIKTNILDNYQELLSEKNKDIIFSINESNIIDISFRKPNAKKIDDLSQEFIKEIELNYLLEKLKDNLKKVQKRNFLSITPKIEDVKLINTWIQKYNVPHYYVQVFLDKVFMLSFENILSILSEEKFKNLKYFIEKDVKNQNKSVIKIDVNEAKEISDKVELPEYKSIMKELSRGRTLFYTDFIGGLVELKEDFNGFERF